MNGGLKCDLGSDPESSSSHTFGRLAGGSALVTSQASQEGIPLHSGFGQTMYMYQVTESLIIVMPGVAFGVAGGFADVADGPPGGPGVAGGGPAGVVGGAAGGVAGGGPAGVVGGVADGVAGLPVGDGVAGGLPIADGVAGGGPAGVGGGLAGGVGSAGVAGGGTAGVPSAVWAFFIRWNAFS